MLICSKYTATTVDMWVNMTDKTCGSIAVSDQFRVVDSSYTDAATFKSAMSGVYLIYELATPTTATFTPFTSPQMVYRNGTEEYIDTRDMPVPVGGNRKYVDIPEWMINEYFDDWRGKTLSTTGGTMTGDLIFDNYNAGTSTKIRTPDDSSGVIVWSNGAEMYVGDNTQNAEIALSKNAGIDMSVYDGTSTTEFYIDNEGVYYNDNEVAVKNDIPSISVSGTTLIINT